MTGRPGAADAARMYIELGAIEDVSFAQLSDVMDDPRLRRRLGRGGGALTGEDESSGQRLFRCRLRNDR